MAKKLSIDPEQVQKLAARMWKNTEIAAFFNCDEGTIRKRFSEELAKGRELGKGKLRDAQLKAAFGGNATMLIWLGKQYLGQTDRLEIGHENLIEQELAFQDVPQKPINGKYKRFLAN